MTRCAGLVRLYEEIVQTPNPTVEDLQSLAASRYQLGALMARRGTGRAEEAAYAAAIEVQQDLVRQYGDRPSTARAWRGTAIIWRCFRTPPGVLRKPSKRFAPRWRSCYPRSRARRLCPAHNGSLPALPTTWAALFLSQRRDDAGQPLQPAQDILLKLTAEFPTIAQYSQELAAIDTTSGSWPGLPAICVGRGVVSGLGPAAPNHC